MLSPARHRAVHLQNCSVVPKRRTRCAVVLEHSILVAWKITRKSASCTARCLSDSQWSQDSGVRPAMSCASAPGRLAGHLTLVDEPDPQTPGGLGGRGCEAISPHPGTGWRPGHWAAPGSAAPRPAGIRAARSPRAAAPCARWPRSAAGPRNEGFRVLGVLGVLGAPLYQCTPSGRSSMRPVALLCSGAAKLGFQGSRGSRGPSLSVCTLAAQLPAPGGLALQRCEGNGAG